MRTLLLNLPWSENGRFGVRAGSRWPFTLEPEKDGYIHYIPFPFFLAYAASLLKKESKEARLIDAIAENIGEQSLLGDIISYNPDIIVIETSTPSFQNDIRIIEDIRKKMSNCHIALCGPHASTFPEHILTKYSIIDSILKGEYEYTLLELVNHLEKNLDFKNILGLAYREGIKIIVNNSRKTIDNLDSLPWPEREDVPIYKYNDGFCNLPQPNVQMWASRGCPFKCTFCLWPQAIYKEHRYRKRNPRDVVNEMEYLVKKFNFKAVYFDDDTFNIDREYVLNICKGIKNRKIAVPWAVMARVDLLDSSLLEIMADSGLYAIKYGIESSDKDILNLCKKDMDLNRAQEMIKVTRQLGIKVHLTFCLGLPGESKETVRRTVNFIDKVHPDSLQFSFAVPFPGTKYSVNLGLEGRLKLGDWSVYDGNYKCIVSTESTNNHDLEIIRAALCDNYNIS